MEIDKNFYLHIFKDLDLNKVVDFKLYMSLLYNSREDCKTFTKFIEKLRVYVPELPNQGLEVIPDFKSLDFYSLNSLEEVRNECVRINEAIKL